LPDILPTLMVPATLPIAVTIVAEAALSFLGLGQQPPSPCWGTMLNVAQRFLTHVPWKAIWPGLAIFLVVHLAARACATRSIRGSGERS
jgi:peptide/nickel transport system permease protein